MGMSELIILFDNNRKLEYLEGIISAYNKGGLLRQDVNSFRSLVSNASLDGLLYMIRTQCSGDRDRLEESFISLCRDASIYGV